MNVNTLKAALPDIAKDVRLNLSSVLTEDPTLNLSQKQIFCIALAAAYATKHLPLIKYIKEIVGTELKEQEIDGAKAAAIMMGMNNIYYRFSHMTHDKEIQKMPAKLRMSVIAKPGIPKDDFELCSLAVSVINSCESCIKAHSFSLTSGGSDKSIIQATARIASVIHSAAVALVTEEI
ncbi:MAG: carboxymuconolactone decarboxylase family protein [Alphaproteobacteria bacterium]